MPDGSQHAVDEFAAWLRQMRLVGGDRSLRVLEKLTERHHERVARSTIKDALDAKRLPSVDQAIAMVRAMTDDEARVVECRKKWTAARSAVTGVALSEMQAPATARRPPNSAVRKPGYSVSDPPTGEASAPGTVPPPHPPAPGSGRTGRPRGKRVGIAAVAVAALAAVGGGVYALRAGDSGGSSGSPRAQEKPQDGYSLVYRGRPAATANADSSIDLTAGKAAAQGAWLLSSDSGGDGKGAFDLQDATDAALSPQPSPTPTECLTAITEKPLAKVSFALAPAGTTFCLRWRLDGGIAVVHVLDLDTGNWAIRVSLDYYRHTGGSSASGSTAPSSSSASEAGYTAAYRDKPAELRSYNDDIDLATGRRTTDEKTWYLSSNAGNDKRGAFELAPGTDVFIAGVTRPGPVTCARRIGQHRPATAPDKVHFPEVPVGNWFCLRSRATGDIVVVQVIDVDTGDWGAKVTLSRFRPKST
ncbi:hypothetical protein [Streptomyces sp. NPDC047000]|uniref:hypothetical protein n=1 Tax=Streptomyces sp. NPDC047000 TaxID=3155474 RepID=UPI0033BFBE36